ncbi:hypothetical protein BaRGS_00025816, partial [Batillaria attramentaria]
LLGHENQHQYGEQRACGSFGFAVGAVTISFVLDELTDHGSRVDFTTDHASDGPFWPLHQAVGLQSLVYASPWGAMSLRMLGYSLLENPWLVLLIEPLHSLDVCIDVGCRYYARFSNCSPWHECYPAGRACRYPQFN